MYVKKKQISLATTTALLICLIVILALSVTGVLIGKNVATGTEKTISEKAMNIARIVAHSPEVTEALDGKRDQRDIQTFTNKIQHITGVRFIVVMDMNHIRKSHPNEKEIGKKFVGADELRAMHGQAYISIAKGTLGRSLRAFTPIQNAAGKQIGVVSVGILLDRVEEAKQHSTYFIYIGVGFGLIIGILGALLFASRVKRVLFGLEPFEIANILQERNAMLESVREGILAINQQGIIVVANAEATRMFHRIGKHENPIGTDVESFMPKFRLQSILHNGTAEYDQELNINGLTFIINRVPIKVRNQIIGVIATFRDRTELKQLAEQLSGVKLYAEALRVNTHEFMNKLHVILGLVQLKQYEKLTSYIQTITEHYQSEIDAVSRLVKDPMLAGFLLSKLSYAREQGMNLTIVGDNPLPQPNDPEIIDDIITIIGNLIDNGMEAVENSSTKEIVVKLEYKDMLFSFTVSDSGSGIPETLQESVFLKGFSTKGTDRGHGLYLIQKNIEKLNGSLEFTSSAHGTIFIVKLPYERKE